MGGNPSFQVMDVLWAMRRVAARKRAELGYLFTHDKVIAGMGPCRAGSAQSMGFCEVEGWSMMASWDEGADNGRLGGFSQGCGAMKGTGWFALCE